MTDTSDDALTPSPKEMTPCPKFRVDDTVKTEVSTNIDPALSGVSSPRSESGDSARDKAEEAWIENIRVIEALRKLISDRLERKEYDDEENVSMSEIESMEKANKTKLVKGAGAKNEESLYPVLRAAIDSAI
jgi:hypothetical protein